MLYDKILLVLYLIVIVIVVVELYDFWGIAIVMLLVLIITLVQKMDIVNKIEDGSRKRAEALSTVLNRIEYFSKNLFEFKQNLSRHLYGMETKIDEVRHEHEVEFEKSYRELAKKIFEIENKLTGVKKTLGAAFGSVDERLKRLEGGTE